MIDVMDQPYGAVGDGSADDTAALTAAYAAAMAGRQAVVWHPPGRRFKVTSGFIFPTAISIMGLSQPCGGIDANASSSSCILSTFNGDLFTFNGANGLQPGSGGGVFNMRLVQNSGSGITANGAGRAIVITGVDLNHKTSWVRVDNCLMEYAAGDSWSWAIDVDGLTPSSRLLDLRVSNTSAHIASSNGGALRVQMGNLYANDCQFYDVAGNVTVTGLTGQTSNSCVFNHVGGVTFAMDWALDTSLIGGIWTSITNTANTGPTTLLMPSRLVNAFTDNSTPGNTTLIHPKGVLWQSGTGSPAGVVAAPVGSFWLRTDGGASTTLYVKESGSGTSGWVAK